MNFIEIVGEGSSWELVGGGKMTGGWFNLTMNRTGRNSFHYTFHDTYTLNCYLN